LTQITFHHFYMEVFLEGYTEEVDQFIKEVTKYFHESVYKNIVAAFQRNPPQADIKDLVRKDLKEIRKIFCSR
jgi:acylphosphatase